jgi:DNA-binding XRE family transcriptional regulator
MLQITPFSLREGVFTFVLYNFKFINMEKIKKNTSINDDARIKKSLTQIQASELLGVTQAQWSAYEVGKSRPNLDTIIEMAKILGIHPYDLIDSSLSKSKYFKNVMPSILQTKSN